MFKNQCNVDVDEIGGFDLDLTIGYFPFLICPNDLHYSRKIVYFKKIVTCCGHQSRADHARFGLTCMIMRETLPHHKKS